MVTNYQIPDQVAEMRRGPYYNRDFQQRVLPSLRAEMPMLVDWAVVRELESQGFSLDPSRDNKSEYEPNALFAQLEKFTLDNGWDPEWHAFDAAWKKTEQKFSKPENRDYLTPLTLEELKLVVKLEKNSGAPYFEKKMQALSKDVKRAERILNGACKPPPCTAYHRIQHGSTGPKTRLVWGYPLSMILIEGRYAAPLIGNFLTHKTPMCIGEVKLTIGGRTLSIRNKRHRYGLDFSRFDASVKPKLIQRAFKILESWFSPEHRADFDQITNYFVFTPIVMPDGNIYMTNRGVPSGSWFTQMVDSIVNYFAIQYCLLRQGIGTVDKLLVLGDDSLFGLNHPLDMSLLVAHASEVGLVLSQEKSYHSTFGQGVHFLGHVWEKALPCRELFETAIRMAFPERWSKANVGLTALQRMLQYITDSVNAWTLIARAAHTAGGVLAILQKLEGSLDRSGWQILHSTVFPEDKQASVRVGYMGPML